MTAELRAQLEDVPALLTKHADRGCVTGDRDRTILEREQPYELRLARPVGAKDGGVLVGLDGQREAVKDGMLALDDRRVVQLKDRTAHAGSVCPLVSRANGSSTRPRMKVQATKATGTPRLP